MKSRTKIFMFSTIIILISFFYYISVLAPYNLQGMLNPNGLGIINQSNLKEIDELAKYFEGYKVNKVKYLGSDSYQVFTDKGEFIILTNYSDSMFSKYKIYKYEKKVKHFTNPM